MVYFSCSFFHENTFLGVVDLMQVPIASEVTTGGLRLIDKEVNGGNFLEGIGFLVSRVTFYLLKVNIDMCKVLDPCSIFHVHFP
jgi:hypothetical protein